YAPRSAPPFPYTTLFRSVESAFPLLRFAEVKIDKILDRGPDILHLRPGHQMRGDRGEQVPAVECVGEFGSAQFPVRDLADLLQRSEEHTSELQSRGHLVC